MKIAVFTDLRFVRTERPTGVSKHIVQMVGGLANLPGIDTTLLVARDQLQRGESTLRIMERLIPLQPLVLPWKTAEVLWTLLGGPPADTPCKGADWVYCPKNDFIPLTNTRLAVTIHGAHELDPNAHRTPGLIPAARRFGQRLSYRRIVQRANLVLTVSAFLKQQIAEHLGCDEKKIHVVGNGVEQVYFDAAHLAPGCSNRKDDRPYILSVGGLNEIDGGELVLDVARELEARLPEARIVVAGWQHEPHLLLRGEAAPNVELAGYVPATTLAPLMRDARALLYVPAYETFGIVAAEAMATRTPILTTGTTAVPEVVGDAALYSSPNAHELCDKLIWLLRDHSTAETLRRRGSDRVRQFTWPKCVSRLNSALRTSQ